MRAASLLALLVSASAGLYASSMPVAADALAPDAKPVQISIRIENMHLAEGTLGEVKRPEVEALLKKGMLAGAEAEVLRPMLAAKIQSGKATVVDALTVTTIQGIPVRLQQGNAGDQGYVAHAIKPRLTDDGISADLDLRIGEKTIRTTVTVPDGGQAAFYVPAPAGARTDQLVILRFTRGAQ